LSNEVRAWGDRETAIVWLTGSWQAWRVDHHQGMVIDMNEAQVSTVEKMRQVLAGTHALEFRQAGDDAGRYAWIDAVLRRMDYRQLKRPERGVALADLQRLSGYSRAQVTRLVSRWMARKPLIKRPRASDARAVRLPAAP
jgi:hypothetical protein